MPDSESPCPHDTLHAHGVRIGKHGAPYRRWRCTECGKVVGSPSHVRGPARGHRSRVGSKSAWLLFERTFRKRLLHVGIPKAIADAAEAAGVSRATASRWLDGYTFPMEDERPERAAFTTLAWRFYRRLHVIHPPRAQHGRLFKAIMSGDAAGNLTEEWTTHGPRLWRALLRAHAMAAVVTGRGFPWWLQDMAPEIRDPAVRRLRRPHETASTAKLPPCRVAWSGQFVHFMVISGGRVVGLWRATLSDFPDIDICIDIGGQRPERGANYIEFPNAPIHFTVVSRGRDWVHDEPAAAHAADMGRLYLASVMNRQPLIPTLTPQPIHDDWDGYSPFTKSEMIRRWLL